MPPSGYPQIYYHPSFIYLPFIMAWNTLGSWILIHKAPGGLQRCMVSVLDTATQKGPQSFQNGLIWQSSLAVGWWPVTTCTLGFEKCISNLAPVYYPYSVIVIVAVPCLPSFASWICMLLPSGGALPFSFQVAFCVDGKPSPL